jgi:hypothetical protein
MFAKAQEHKLNMLRLFLIGDDSPTRIVLMKSPGNAQSVALHLNNSRKVMVLLALSPPQQQ